MTLEQFKSRICKNPPSHKANSRFFDAVTLNDGRVAKGVHHGDGRKILWLSNTGTRENGEIHLGEPITEMEF